LGIRGFPGKLSFLPFYEHFGDQLEPGAKKFSGDRRSTLQLLISKFPGAGNLSPKRRSPAGDALHKGTLKGTTSPSD
jgi:hypothetical protein